MVYTLSRTTFNDLPDDARLHSDPAVWQHSPSGRHTSVEQSREGFERDLADCDRDDLGFWIVRAADDTIVPRGQLLGVAGCRAAHDGLFWNLYYRLSPRAQGHGPSRRRTGPGRTARSSPTCSSTALRAGVPPNAWGSPCSGAAPTPAILTRRPCASCSPTVPSPLTR